ncbi:hypothetical protein [Citrobacter freundii]|uniref:hypothetical protein n=1 Tax=Citrobacter freundii TaxID=546 RepID=UPI0020C6B082|nr:hypothetical protein [Citrobacter freundii]
MTIQPYVCTDPEIVALREKMAALLKKHDLPVLISTLKLRSPHVTFFLKPARAWILSSMI